MDLEGWLRSLDLEQYEAAFRENDIDISVVSQLSDQDLKELGVSLGHRRKMLAAIAELSRAPGTIEKTPAPSEEPAKDAERRQLTVMFCDLVGSTALSGKLDPEDMREIVGAYHHCSANLITKAGGFVAKYMGDGVLAYFGYPQAHEHDAERAVRAGLALVEDVPKVTTAARVPLQVRVGIATGLVVVGDLIGSGEAQERGIVGETPNVAARLQALADPNAVVIADSTRRLLGNLFEFRDLGPSDLKGIAGLAQAWSVLRASSVESRFDALHTTGLTALVGRDEESELLLRRWSRAKAGQGQVVLLSGEGGIGKSRLTAELLERLAPEPYMRLRYFCSPQHTDSAFHPFIGQLERAAGLTHEDKPQEKLNKLDAVLAQTTTSPEDAALFAGMLSLANDGRYPALALTPEQRRRRTLEALTSQLAGSARQRPVLMIFEDVHWIDPTSLEVLGRTVDRIKALPALLIVTFRPEFDAPWAGQSHVTSLTLNRLGEREAAAIIALLVGNKELPADVMAEIVERTDGIPLFVEEMTKAVLEAESEGGARRMVAAVPSPVIAVPASLHASLMARLDRLGPAKEVAQIGSVIGREFSHALLASVARKPDEELRSAFDRLLQAGLLSRQGVPPQASYLFKHALVQDAAYSTLLRGARQNLHARVADALLTISDLASVAPEIIARHMQNAERPADAIVYWRKAGEQSVRRANNREAVVHFRRALSLLEAQSQTSKRWRTELSILSQLAPALMSFHGWAAVEVGEVVERALEVGRRLESSEELAPSIANLWLFHYASGRLDAAEKVSDDLFRIARELNSPDVLLQAHHTAWPVRCWGRGAALAEAVEHIDAGLALYDEERHAHHRFLYLGHDPAVCGLAIGAQVYWTLGYPMRASGMAEQALALARRLKHEPSLVHGLWFIVEWQLICHDVAGVIANTVELLQLAEQYGLPLPRAIGLVYRGWALASSGLAAEGVGLAEHGVAFLERSGARLFLPRTYAAIAEAYFALGRYADALDRLDDALRIASEIRDSFYPPRLFLIRAKLMQALSQSDDVIEQDLRHSLELARAQGAKAFELRAAIGLAGLWQRQGKSDKGREFLTPICDWFTEGLDMPDFREAKALLNTLS
jgi:class 3 adenylate cyclase/tetratricopeptide (TPR) repeat protein